MRRDTIITGKGSIISKRAVAAAARLRRNTADWYANRISFDVRGERNRRIWRGIARIESFHGEVLICLNDEGETTMTMPKHTHRAATNTTRPFMGPVGSVKHQNQMAHGGICDVSVCSCGAERRTNINGLHIERGTWFPRAED